MDNRRFGVEIEFGFSGQGRERLVDLLRRKGLPNWRDVGHDGTELELRSPILQGADGFRQLKKVYHILKQNGGIVTSRDGMHIHHDAPEFINDDDLQRRLILSWNNNQDIIDNFVSPDRRPGGSKYHWCPRWQNNDLVKIQKNEIQYYDRYEGYKMGEWKRDRFAGPRGALHIATLDEHGTIEIRQHEGTLEFEEAAAWIRFGQRFIAGVINRKNPIPILSGSDVMMNRLRLGEKVKADLVKKAKNSRPNRLFVEV